MIYLCSNIKLVFHLFNSAINRCTVYISISISCGQKCISMLDRAAMFGVIVVCGTEDWRGGPTGSDGPTLQVHLHQRLDRSYSDAGDTLPSLPPRCARPMVWGARPDAHVSSAGQCSALWHPNTGTETGVGRIHSVIVSKSCTLYTVTACQQKNFDLGTLFLKYLMKSYDVCFCYAFSWASGMVYAKPQNPPREVWGYSVMESRPMKEWRNAGSKIFRSDICGSSNMMIMYDKNWLRSSPSVYSRVVVTVLDHGGEFTTEFVGLLEH